MNPNSVEPEPAPEEPKAPETPKLEQVAFLEVEEEDIASTLKNPFLEIGRA
jgi:hypothetical protein